MMILSRVELLEINQYSQGHMMPPPRLMGQHIMVPPATNMLQLFLTPSQISSPFTTVKKQE